MTRREWLRFAVIELAALIPGAALVLFGLLFTSPLAGQDADAPDNRAIAAALVGAGVVFAALGPRTMWAEQGSRGWRVATLTILGGAAAAALATAVGVTDQL